MMQAKHKIKIYKKNIQEDLTFVYTVYTFTLMITTITITAALIALICDAKATDAHKLNVRRLHRKLVRIKKANEATELDVLYYTSNIGK